VAAVSAMIAAIYASKSTNHHRFGRTLIWKGAANAHTLVTRVTWTVVALIVMMAGPLWAQERRERLTLTPQEQQTLWERMQKEAEELELPDPLRKEQEDRRKREEDAAFCAKSKDPALCEMFARRLRGIETTGQWWVLWRTVIFSPDLPVHVHPSIDPVAEFPTLHACKEAESLFSSLASRYRRMSGSIAEYPYVLHDCHPAILDPRLAPRSHNEWRWIPKR
jgi:hypothetical protein